MSKSQYQRVINLFWNYYLELEKEVLLTKEYIDFEKNNYKIFSHKLLRLFLSICSEIDSIGKQIAKKIDPTFVINRNTTIAKWWNIVQNQYVCSKDYNLKNVGISIKSYEIENRFTNSKTKPWENYNVITNNQGRACLVAGSKTPQWWLDYNSVKHDRIEDGSIKNYSKANLKNVLNSIGALYILEILMLKLYCDDDILYNMGNDTSLFKKQVIPNGNVIDGVWRPYV